MVAAEAGDVHVERSGTDVHQRARAFPVHAHVAKALPQADDDTLHAAVAHQQVGAETDRRYRYLGGPGGEEVCQIVDIRGAKHDIRTPAGAKPDGAGEVHVERVAAADPWQPVNPVRHLAVGDHEDCPAGEAACTPPLSSSSASGSIRAQ